MMKLPRSFYTRSAIAVAPELLGKVFVRSLGSIVLKGMITEVEAYMGAEDPASHAYKGQTMRNSVMFGEGGHLYVYFTYGMHYCANVVTGGPEYAQAVLIRGVAPIEGIETMIEHRSVSIMKHIERNKNASSLKTNAALKTGMQTSGKGADRPGGSSASSKKLAAIGKHIADGPAKFCQAFAIGRRDNGTDLCGNEIYILDAPAIPRRLVQRSVRIGISSGKEHEWRFFLDTDTIDSFIY